MSIINKKIEIDSVWKHKDINRKVRVTNINDARGDELFISFEGVDESLFGGERQSNFLKYYELSSPAAVRNVVFVSDNEGNNFYIPASQVNDFYVWCKDYPSGNIDGDYFKDAILVEGESYIVDIIDKF